MAELGTALRGIEGLAFGVRFLCPNGWVRRGGRLRGGYIGEVGQRWGQGGVRDGGCVGDTSHVDGVGEFVDESEGEEESGTALLGERGRRVRVGVQSGEEDGGEVDESVGAEEGWKEGQGGCGAVGD